MITLIKHSKTSIIFFSIITFLGLITGYKFYTYQEQETKTKIIETLNIEENLSYKTNNILKDLKDIFIILRGSLPGLFYSCNALLMPCNGNSLNITNAAASAGNTVFHQIFDKVGGEAQLVIQI